MASSYHKRPFYLLAAFEAVACTVGFVLAAWATRETVPTAGASAPGVAVATGTVLLTLLAVGLYDWRHAAQISEVAVRLLAAVGMALIGLGFMIYFFGLPSVPPLQAGIWIALVVPFLLGLRWGFVRIVDLDRFKARVLVLGSGANARALADLQRAAQRRPYRIIGFVRSGDSAVEVPRGQLWDRCDALAERVQAAGIDEIVVALDDRRGQLPADDLIEARLMGVIVTDYQRYCERVLGRVDLAALRPSWFIFNEGFRQSRIDRWLKRAFDVGVSAVLLILFAPVMLATALLIKLDSRGPVLYRQERVGRGGRPFNLLKFRSMRVDAEAAGSPVWAQANDPRVTRVGAVIRKVRIDEMPQLVNVLTGEMSIVGPRPERPAFVEMLEAEIPFYRERHVIKPGITGWAQLNYPYGASVEDAKRKLEYDLYYIKSFSILFDAIILIQTVRVILWNEGAR